MIITSFIYMKKKNYLLTHELFLRKQFMCTGVHLRLLCVRSDIWIRVSKSDWSLN